MRSLLRTFAIGLTSSALMAVAIGVRADDDNPKEKPKETTKSIPAIRLIPATKAAEKEKKAPPSTHEQVKAIVVKGEKGISLQTICPGPDGQILALVAKPRYGAPGKSESAGSEVRAYDADGEQLSTWKVNFVAQSINSLPDGSVFVAGDGRIAKFSKDGKLVVEAELPHLAKVLGDTDTLKKKAEEQLKDQVKSFEDMVTNMTRQKEELEKKDAEKLTKAEKNQLKAFEANIKAYEQIAKQYKNQSVDDVVKEMTARLRVINAVAADEKDVYVACGEVKGYGYAIWRMNHQFEDPQQIAKGLSGCCGQMDIQCCGGEVLVAENSRHRVIRYDREGKKVAVFGKSQREGEGEGFGSCCNPMNLRGNTQGIYTAESEGFVKLFSPAGEFISAVGTVKIQGGCKNVGIAVSGDGSKVYFCDQPAGKILVLAKKNGTKSEE